MNMIEIVHGNTSIPKLCKNCKYLTKNGFLGYNFARCTKIYSINLIDGSYIYEYASISREYKCKAEYFEEKEKTSFEKFLESIKLM